MADNQKKIIPINYTNREFETKGKTCKKLPRDYILIHFKILAKLHLLL